MLEPIKAIVDPCLYVLGIFVAGLIFLFCVSILIVASYLAIVIGRDLYNLYIKDLIEILRKRKGKHEQERI